MRRIPEAQAIRILEHIYYWKAQEKEHAYFIHWIFPSLQDPLKKLMKQWEQHFYRSENKAMELWQKIRRAQEFDEQHLQELNRFLDVMERQSREWVRHLLRMTGDSKAIQNEAAGRPFIHHCIRESDYFLRGLQALDGMEYRNAHHAIPTHGALPPERRTKQAIISAMPAMTSANEDEPRPINTRAVTLTKTNEGTWTLQSPEQGHFMLPSLHPLPFAVDALEPHLSATLIEKHYYSYCAELAKRYGQAVQQLNYEKLRGDEMHIRYWQQKVDRLEAIHELHRLYWNALDPQGGGHPTGPIANQIEADFGHFAHFQDHFMAFAMQEECGGWVVLAWNPASHRLVVHSMNGDSIYSQWNVLPLLVLDMEEHAYMLQYDTNRREYINAWWSLIHWGRINERFMHARRLQRYSL